MEDNRSKLAALLETPHADVNYLKQHEISLVLSKALSDTFKAKPLEPKKYFAKYLLNYAAQKRKEKEVSVVDQLHVVETYDGFKLNVSVS